MVIIEASHLLASCKKSAHTREICLRKALPRPRFQTHPCDPRDSLRPAPRSCCMQSRLAELSPF